MIRITDPPSGQERFIRFSKSGQDLLRSKSLEQTNRLGHFLDTLFMGMTDDLEQAGRCVGATHVRFGSVLKRAKPALQEIWMAETRAEANQAFDAFVETYLNKYPKVVEILSKDREELMVLHVFPAKHWQSIRTTNPIESDFATIRHRTQRSKGCLTRNSVMFKLDQCAKKILRRLRGFRQLDQVIEGINLIVGIEGTQFNDRVAA